MPPGQRREILAARLVAVGKSVGMRDNSPQEFDADSDVAWHFAPWRVVCNGSASRAVWTRLGESCYVGGEAGW